jgi:amphi-Trp domain-containing protein
VSGPGLPSENGDDVSDELIELTERTELRREAAAARLRQLADQLSRHNEVAFSRDGVRYAIAVPDVLKLKVEIEIGDDEKEIEVELTW